MFRVSDALVQLVTTAESIDCVAAIPPDVYCEDPPNADPVCTTPSVCRLDATAGDPVCEFTSTDPCTGLRNCGGPGVCRDGGCWTEPVPETCDGFDNDCDFAIDELDDTDETDFAHWPFDGTINDVTGSTAGTTLLAGPVSYASGVANQALQLSASGSGVTTPDSEFFDDFSSGFSLLFWFQIESAPQHSAGLFLSKRPNYPVQFSINIQEYNPSVASSDLLHSTGGVSTMFVIPNLQLPAPGTWIHYAWVYDPVASTSSGYLDGVPRALSSTVGWPSFLPNNEEFRGKRSRNGVVDHAIDVRPVRIVDESFFP